MNAFKIKNLTFLPKGFRRMKTIQNFCLSDCNFLFIFLNETIVMTKAINVLSKGLSVRPPKTVSVKNLIEKDYFNLQPQSQSTSQWHHSLKEDQLKKKIHLRHHQTAAIWFLHKTQANQPSNQHYFPNMFPGKAEKRCYDQTETV